MGNQYLSQILFNEKLKNEFIESYMLNTNNNTAVLYKYIFQKSYEKETQLNKDIYKFNDEELRNLILSYENGSEDAVATNVSVLRRYLDFCIEKEYINLNLLQDFSSKTYSMFVDKTAQHRKIIDREQFEKMVAYCENYQDKYVIAMPFYGFSGEEYCEITNLKISDVHFQSNTIHIKNRNKDYNIDDYLMNIISGAINEKEYKNLNNVRISQLHENDYVARVIYKNANDPIDKSLVVSRFMRARKNIGNPFLTLTSLKNSGMIDSLKGILADKKELTREDWIEVGEVYGYDEKFVSKNKRRFESFLLKHEE